MEKNHNNTEVDNENKNHVMYQSEEDSSLRLGKNSILSSSFDTQMEQIVERESIDLIDHKMLKKESEPNRYHNSISKELQLPPPRKLGQTNKDEPDEVEELLKRI